MKLQCHNRIVIVGLLIFHLFANSVRANVYATDIRLNGSSKAKVILPGENLTISYILNESATGGVWIQICSGTNIIETLASTNGNAGTNAGLNSVVLEDVTNLAEGVYSVSITAASAGCNAWTNITDDGTNFSLACPRGITVNQNTNSPFYGRVYVGNAYNNGDGVPGDQVGILKYNADGSPADEGGFSTGGYGWAGDKYSPWKMAVGPGDRLYVDDFAISSQGLVVSFNPTIDDNSLCEVIGKNNYPEQYPNLQLSGLAFTEFGTNMQIWMPDENPSGSAGIIGWQMTADGAPAANDTGSIIVAADPFTLSQAPYDLAVASNGLIYVIQFLTTDYPAYGLLRYPAYAGEPEAMADWVVPAYQFLFGASGVAVDPTATFVAVAVVGQCDPETACGGLYLYSAVTGDLITNLDKTGGDPYYDVAWDNAGNLYALDGVPSNAVWRVYSPPGTNRATTVAAPFIQAYNTLTPPVLLNPEAVSNGMCFTLKGQSNVTYIVEDSCDLTHWKPMATNYSTNASRSLCVHVHGDVDFFRAVTAP